ncbi:hypothetical protein NDU88_001238 [Pleurodeles waltl]|uniref:Reverse transcriptase zinc-binding domain-containing protein n=1 Tax=Pleurodeles waltl TaxID=8319 RepID=A0AAV7R961_PLEWA|nr:hypothetical protein NDU88_001238 [Pleurodeles waltl]
MSSQTTAALGARRNGSPRFQGLLYSGRAAVTFLMASGRNPQEIGYSQTLLARGELQCLICPGSPTPRTVPLLLLIAVTYWKLTRCYTASSKPYPLNIPLVRLPTATGVLSWPSLWSWEQGAVTTVGANFGSGSLLKHTDFLNKQNMSNSLFLTHADITSYIKQYWAPNGMEPPTYKFVQAMDKMGHGRHLMRGLYRGIREHLLTSLTPLRTKWEEDLGRELRDREWAFLLASPKSNILAVPSACPRCAAGDTTLVHMLWRCTALSSYWPRIQGALEDLTERDPWHTFESCTLGLFPRPKGPKVMSAFADLSLLQAKRLLPGRWKSTMAPTIMQ